MPRFEKGNNGKRLGSKHLAQFKISYWLDKIAEEWKDLTPNQRANISLELTKILINKSKALPTDPIDSNLNASALLLTLKQAEEGKEIKQVDVKIDKV